MMFSWDSVVNSFSGKKMKKYKHNFILTITCTVFKLLKMISIKLTYQIKGVFRLTPQ